MSKGKIDKMGLASVIFWLIAAGALYYFSYTTTWGAVLLLAFEFLLLFWSVLSPLYVLIRMGLAHAEKKRAARLGLSLEQYQLQQRARRGLPSPEEAAQLRQARHSRWRRHLLHISQWELAAFTLLLLLFGALAHHWRQQPDDVTALGVFYAMLLYTFLGLQLLHRVWAHWHHRLVPGSAPPAEISAQEKLSRAQSSWNAMFCLALLFALVELMLSGSGQATAVISAFLAPALVLLLVASVWRMLRPLFRHRRVPALQKI